MGPMSMTMGNMSMSTAAAPEIGQPVGMEATSSTTDSLTADSSTAEQADGSKVKRFCSQCGASTGLGDRFCAYCGHQLTQ